MRVLDKTCPSSCSHPCTYSGGTSTLFDLRARARYVREEEDAYVLSVEHENDLEDGHVVPEEWRDPTFPARDR